MIVSDNGFLTFLKSANMSSSALYPIGNIKTEFKPYLSNFSNLMAFWASFSPINFPMKAKLSQRVTRKDGTSEVAVDNR